MLILKVKFPDGQTKEYPVNYDNLIIGRGEDTDIRVNIATISRKHAQLEKVGPNTWELVDLGSHNKIVLPDGKKVDTHIIKPPGKFLLGQAEFLLCEKDTQTNEHKNSVTQEENEKEKGNFSKSSQIGQMPAITLDSLQIETNEEEGLVVTLVNQILKQALNQGASDIHIEPYENKVQVRYRIDGMLYTIDMPPEVQEHYAAIISRIKIMAGLDITEKRLPQDGSFKIEHNDENIDVRVSIIPYTFGEGAALRLLTNEHLSFNFVSLGMDKQTIFNIKKLVSKTQGIILVTGPTGSGKTLTLLTIIRYLIFSTSSRKKVITIEDPVEHHIPNCNQIHVNMDTGLSFARGLRSILRHDPDVIMIGEIRDTETAHIAIQAALTGHLVLSSLHTNDACSTITRLIDMGIEPYLVATAIKGVLAQRLVRLVCDKCKQAYKPRLDRLPEGMKLEEGQMLYRSNGCEYCRNTGFRGRTGIFELVTMTDKLREAIISRIPEHQIANIAIQEGMNKLIEDGWRKVKSGITTIEEVLRVTAEL